MKLAIELLKELSVIIETYSFAHYGEAKQFARKINGRISIKKTLNPFKYIGAMI